MEPRELLFALAKAITTNFDYRQMAESLNYNELASAAVDELDYDDVANRLDYDEVANRLDCEEVARNIDMDDLAQHVNWCEVVDVLSIPKVAGEINLAELAVEVDKLQKQAGTDPKQQAVQQADSALLAELYANCMVYEQGGFVPHSKVVAEQMHNNLEAMGKAAEEARIQADDNLQAVSNRLAAVEARLQQLDEYQGVHANNVVELQKRVDVANPIKGVRSAADWQIEDLRIELVSHRDRLTQCELSTRALYEAFLCGYAKAMEMRP